MSQSDITLLRRQVSYEGVLLKTNVLERIENMFNAQVKIEELNFNKFDFDQDMVSQGSRSCFSSKVICN